MSGLQKAKLILFSLISVCLASPLPCASSVPDTTYKKLAAWEIDDLTQPVALYPDVILKALLPASTFPDQIVDAALLIKDKSDAELIQKQAWDPSVKVVATYPGVLRTMFEDLDWTTRFGEAYLNQHKDLLASLQRMRTKAKELGNLKSNDKQTVTTQKASNGETVVVIQPTNPEVVYVPTTTTVVYEESGHSTDSSLAPLAAFGIGMALGAAMNDDDDYYGGGYWGGGPVYWGGDNYNNWSDNRRAAWEDYNDRRWDQQEFRQGQKSDRQEFRQGQIESGNYNKDQINQRKEQASTRANDYRANNPDAAARADARKSGTGAQSSEQFSQRKEQANAKMGDYKAKNPDAAARMDSRKASGETQMARAGTGERSAFDKSAFHPKGSQSGSGGLYGSGSRSGSASSGGSAFSGYGSRSSTSAMSSRGSSSRSSSGYSGGGGMRGGGGGMRGGGGRGGGGRR